MQESIISKLKSFSQGAMPAAGCAYARAFIAYDTFKLRSRFRSALRYAIAFPKTKPKSDCFHADAQGLVHKLNSNITDSS
ncbi:hypothetical protein [Nostoc sp.]|uniref:hypothetical protein n=1 Tax=Nostoc sp. TaxID=1180 RepID=UPI002FF9FC25